MTMDKVPNITKKQLLPYIRKAWKSLRTWLNVQKATLGPRYKRNNIYEQLSKRFCDPAIETEKFFDEYMLCLNKVSKQPASIREAVLNVGGQAVDLYLAKRKERLEKRRLQRKEKKETKEK